MFLFGKKGGATGFPYLAALGIVAAIAGRVPLTCVRSATRFRPVNGSCGLLGLHLVDVVNQRSADMPKIGFVEKQG